MGETGMTCDLYNTGYLESFTGGAGVCNTDFYCPENAPAVPEYHIICTRVNLPFNYKCIDLDGKTMGETSAMGCLTFAPDTIAVLGSLMGLDRFMCAMDLAEMVIYNDAGLETRDRIETYLSEKYGIPLVAKVCGDHGIHAADLSFTFDCQFCHPAIHICSDIIRYHNEDSFPAR